MLNFVSIIFYQQKGKMKNFTKLLALLALVLTASSHALSQQDVNGWFWLNGRPTGNSLNWVSVQSATKFYAFGNKGTFAMSTDGGSQWTINSQVGLKDAASSYRDLRTASFIDANTGYVAGGSLVNTVQGAVFKTTDGGMTWSTMQYNDSSGSVNGIYFLNASTGFLCGGTRARIHKTTDGGTTWSDISTGLSGTNTYNAIFAIDENNIFVAFSTRRLYYTSNGGANWSLITLPGTTGGTTMTDVYFKDASTGYACGNPNYFAYTTNGGANWTQSNAASATLGQRDLTYHNSTLYMLGGSRAYLYRSTNDGASWDSLRFYDSSNVNQPLLTSTTFNSVSVNGNDMVIVGSNGHVTVSSDGGATWTNKNYSVNSGSNFYTSIYMASDSDMWLTSGGGVGSLLHTTDAGSTWVAIPSSHSSAMAQIDFGSTDTAFSCGGNVAGSIGQVGKSVNGGMNWAQIPVPAANHTYLALDFLTGSIGYVGGGGAGLPANIYKTTDGGTSWITQALGYSGSVLSIKMFDLSFGYALGNLFHKTTNGGTNWVAQTTPSGALSNMFALNNDVVVLGGAVSSSSNNPVIYRTTNGGINWTNITGDLPDSVVVGRTEWLNINDGVAGCTGGLVAKTTNGGINWVISNQGFGNISDVAMTTRNLWYAVASNGSAYQVGRKTENLTSISVNLNIGIEGFWNGTTQVTDTVTVELRSSVSPYNVADVAQTVLTPGIGYGTFQFNSAPSGTYYIVVIHRNSLETWSALPVSMQAGGNYNYDFTSDGSQSYGSNSTLKLGRFCIYSGDVNQDGLIDGTDLFLVDNDALAGVTGYVNTDLNGDGIVDGTDEMIADNNVFNYVMKMTPP